MAAKLLRGCDTSSGSAPRVRSVSSRYSRANIWSVDEEDDDTPPLTPPVVMSAHEAALLRNPELVAQFEIDQADPSRAVRSEARRPRQTSGQ